MAKVLPFRRPSQPEEPAPKRSDAELIVACASGDRDALGTLFDRHAQALAAFLTRLTCVREQEVDDLVQETFLVVFRAAPSFAQGASVKTWIFGVGANVARDRVRKASRFASLRVRLSLWASDVDERAPERIALSVEGISRLSAALAALPLELRTAFLMCDVEELSGVEVAATLGVPMGTLYRRIHEARRRLRDAMSEDPSDAPRKRGKS